MAGSTATTPGTGPEAGSRARSPLPAPTLPRGGGAVHGLGERFSVDAGTGGCSLTVPVPVSPGRGASGADLALVYRPGTANSPFGMGWQVGVSSVARRTSREVPTYTDADTFTFNGEDLVPLLRPNGVVYDEPETIDGVARRVRRFRPRTEAAYTRVEQCRDPATGDMFWRTVSRDNVTMIFGRTAASRVQDPADHRRVAEWLLDEVRDDRGNVATYEYKAEDTTGVQPSIFEQHRLAPNPAPANRYLKFVRYANATPGDRTTTRVTVAFDYGEHDEAIAQAHPWPVRADPFSSYRTGFEVRIWRLCRRIMVFHDFGADQGPGPLPRLVRTLELTHQPDPAGTMLASVRQVGYDWSGGGYQTLALPPLELTYTAATPATAASTAQVQAVPDGARMRWLDLDGDGLPGLLSCVRGAWWYQRPAGDGRWDPSRRVAELPVTARLPGPPELVDVDGTGRLSAASGGELPGTSVLEVDGSWSPWLPYADRPVIDPAQPGLRSQDLDGDGLPDLVLAGPDEVSWQPSRGRGGYGPRVTVRNATDVDAGAALFSVDLNGDGLPDLVRIRNGQVDYWPNLGRGRFGARVRMAGSPTFDHPDQFDPGRIRLADLDGTGRSDLIYLGRHQVTAWTNRAGNAWAPGVAITALPPVRRLDEVQVLDLLGKGTPCLVWTTSAPGGDGVVARYLDLHAGPGRPRMLESFRNNLGAITTITLGSSTAYALADRSAGDPWATRLRSPVPVVSRVEIADLVSGTSHSTTYRYRDGYSDPDEREFRGFGRVEVLDAERFPAPPPGTPAVHQPPTRTVTWYHLGRFSPNTGAFDGDPAALELDGHEVAGAEGGLEYRQALRALAGRPTRVEVYGEDGVSANPYTVSQHRMRVVRIQPARDGAPAVFRVDHLETLECWYERTLDDPRTVHTLTLQTDDYGTVRSSARVAYPRRTPQIPEQQRPLISWTLTDVTHTDTATVHRLGVVTATRAYEVTGVNGPYTPQGLVAALPGLPELAFEQQPSHVTAQRRLVEASRHEYWSDALTAALPPGQVGTRALPRQTRRLAFTPGLVAGVYPAEVDATVLTAEGGYELIDGLWWATDGVLHYDPAVCYQPERWDSAFGNAETVEYDAHGLLVVATQASDTAPLDLNRATVANDYRVLAPRQIVDPNGVTSRVRFDALGRVTAAWLTAPDGVLGDPPALPGVLHEYGSGDWLAGIGPAWSHTETREVAGDAGSGWRRQRMYTDGLGRIVMTKTAAEPGPALTLAGIVDTTPNPRWIGTGRTVFNDKGFPIEQYEPYFATTVAFESADELVKQGLTQIRGYDPLGRVTRVDYPDGTHERHELGPWTETAWDRNDTVLASEWYAQRQGAGTPAPQVRAATVAAGHANTPTVSLCDALGRVVRTRADNGPNGVAETVLHLGTQGERLAVDDALGRRAVGQTYDALGRVLATDSIDAGRQVALPAVDGLPVRHWSAHGYAVRCGYDGLRRPTHLFVRDPGALVERLAEYSVYGEAHPQAAGRFLVGRLHRRYDQAGLSRAERHDPAGHLVEGARQVLAAGVHDPDWTSLDGQPLAALDTLAATQLDGEVFTAGGTFDAVGRPLTQQLPDGTVLTLGYGVSGELTSVSGVLAGAAAATAFVTAMDYDEHRRRTSRTLGCGVITTYDYDPPSSRLLGLASKRGTTRLQDLSYAYDPMGNVVQIDDAAQQTVFFDGAVAAPTRTFGYDPLYRLTEATGREHASLGQQPDATPPALTTLPHPNDANALRPYAQTYSYDAVGNLLALAHAGGPSGSWTRRYAYGPASNRLLAHSLPGDPAGGPYSATFDHDDAGGMTRMPTVPGMTWDHAGRLRSADLNGGGTVRYHHDAAGNRVRKVWQRQGALREERIYLGDYELFRRYLGGALVFERRTLHVLDGRRTVALVETVTVDTQGSPNGEPVLRYQLADHLGSSAVECDAAGQVISYEEYHPYGTTAMWLARGAAAVSTKRYRYTGKEHDEETGLYHNGARQYAPWLGRWTSPDPRGLADGTNRYAYVNGNPVRLIDPNGMQSQSFNLWNKGPLPYWQGIAPGEQLWFSEAKPFWAEARATAKSRGFTPELYQYFRNVAQSWGAPQPYALGHMGKPFVFLRPGEDSWIGIQSVASNARQAQLEKGMAGLARQAGIPVRSGDLFPGAKLGQRFGQPPIPTFQGIQVRVPPAHSGQMLQLPLPFGPRSAPPSGQPWQQLELDFSKPAKPPTPPPNPTAAAGAAEASAATTATADAGAASKAAPVVNETATGAKAATTEAAAAGKAGKLAPAAGEAGAATKLAPAAEAGATAKVAPVAADATTASKVAPAVTDTAAASPATKAAPVARAAATEGTAATATTAATTATDTSAAAKVAPVVDDAAAAAKTDAALANAAEKGTQALKTAAPVVKQAAPAMKEAGALTRIVDGGSKVLKAAAPVIKVAKPVVRVVGEVAKPLGVGIAAADLATANNNSDRLVASGDLVAGVAMYCGPVGEAFGVGYTVGGLADKGIAYASKNTVGVDLSPSNMIAHQLDAADKVLSAVLPDSKDQPAYKQENKVAWFLIDKLGF